MAGREGSDGGTRDLKAGKSRGKESQVYYQSSEMKMSRGDNFLTLQPSHKYLVIIRIYLTHFM